MSQVRQIVKGQSEHDDAAFPDFWGQFTVTNFNYPACQSSYTVRAYDTKTVRWSNSATVYYLTCLT